MSAVNKTAAGSKGRAWVLGMMTPASEDGSLVLSVAAASKSYRQCKNRTPFRAKYPPEGSCEPFFVDDDPDDEIGIARLGHAVLPAGNGRGLRLLCRGYPARSIAFTAIEDSITSARAVAARARLVLNFFHCRRPEFELL